MSIVRVSESTAFDSTAATSAAAAGSSILSYVEGPHSVATVIASATPHAKGSYYEVTSATTADIDMIHLAVSGIATNATDTAVLLDIATGAAAAEVVLVPDIACGGASGMTNTGGSWDVMIPMQVSSGTRIAVRAQAAVASEQFSVYVTLYSGSSIQGSTAVALGVDTGTSAGVEVGTAWTEIVASTAATYDALVVCPSLSTATASSATTPLIIGTGAASSEVEVARIPVYTSIFEDIRCVDRLLGWGKLSILPGLPAGARLVAKRATTACDVSFIGIT